MTKVTGKGKTLEKKSLEFNEAKTERIEVRVTESEKTMLEDMSRAYYGAPNVSRFIRERLHIAIVDYKNFASAALERRSEE